MHSPICRPSKYHLGNHQLNRLFQPSIKDGHFSIKTMGNPLRSLATATPQSSASTLSPNAFFTTFVYEGQSTHATIVDLDAPMNLIRSSVINDESSGIFADRFEAGEIKGSYKGYQFTIIGIARLVTIDAEKDQWRTFADIFVVQDFPVPILLGQPWYKQDRWLEPVDNEEGQFLVLGQDNGIRRLECRIFDNLTQDYLSNPPHLSMAQPSRVWEPSSEDEDNGYSNNEN